MSAVAGRPVAAASTALSYEALCAFVYAEARLQDANDYDAWEALWTNDASYWVPFGGDHTDPEHQISIIYDNRARIATRVRQLKSGIHYAQTPQSNLCRVVSNVEVVERREHGGPPEADLRATFHLAEWRSGSNRLWAGSTRYTVRVEDGALRLVRKKVLLINSTEEIPTMAFLI